MEYCTLPHLPSLGSLIVVALFILALQAEDFQDLIEHLGHDDVRVREEATSLLTAAGERAIPALLKALESPDPEIRGRATNILLCFAGRIPSKSLSLELEEAKNAENGDVKIVIRATNTAPRRLLLYVPYLTASYFAIKQAPPERFEWLESGKAIAVEIEGTTLTETMKPEPLYKGMIRNMTLIPTTAIFRIQFSDPGDIAKILTDIFTSLNSPEKQPSWFVVDPRTRSVIFTGPREHLKVMGEVIEQLDSNPMDEVIWKLDADTPETPHINAVPLINHTASDLATILQNLINGDQSGQRSTQSMPYGH